MLIRLVDLMVVCLVGNHPPTQPHYHRPGNLANGPCVDDSAACHRKRGKRVVPSIATSGSGAEFLLSVF